MPESPEAIAFELFKIVAHSEKKAENYNPLVLNADRGWILQAYAECLKAVNTPSSVKDVSGHGAR